ncbi:hypothetical protein BV25DRAFT_677701 [Artomyces pyxidatus]|uniref:Uncharacterized protein n=1 Tax=Artomyces pyxidatus TaxID=48021 RepID=A0ACB8T0Y1_9AGAM|nr:hypothetical protein BV25DRAFT_677701 [Artomyces pyxidatus]
MACSASATETQYATITSTSLVTTFSASVETLSSSLSTVLSSSCISSVSGICAATTIITEVDTIPGAISTVQLPVVVANVVIEAIPTLTLFASCSSIQSTEAGPTSPIVTDSSSASFITASTTTPPPTALTTQVFTALDNGSIPFADASLMSQPSSSAAYVYTSTPAADSEPTPQRSNTSGSSSNLAPILGGVLGGFFFLIVVVVLIWII